MTKIITLLTIAISSFYSVNGQVKTELPMIEDFERDTGWIWSPWNEISIPKSSSISTGCAHSGKFGLNCIDDYFIRNDIQIGYPGEVISCWVRFQRKTNAYLGFGGRNTLGTERGYHLAIAPERNSFDFRRSADYTYPNLKSVPQTYKMNTWYKLELIFKSSTHVIGNLYSSNGTTLINSIELELPNLTPGGISFRGHFLHLDDLKAGTMQVISDSSFEPKLGEPFTLNNIVFESNKSNLLEQSYVDLKKLVVYLKNNPNYKIIIIGHTDNFGNEVDNKNLSIARAEAVADYLLKNGINKVNITHVGYGSSKPITTNSTEEGRQKNRRVEIVLRAN